MTSAESPNRVVLKAVAERIEELLSEVVFVGGQVVELLILIPPPFGFGRRRMWMPLWRSRPGRNTVKWRRA